MKSYDEIYENVLRRRDVQLAKKRRRIAVVSGAVLPAFMLTAAATVGVVAWQGGLSESNKELGGASAPGAEEYTANAEYTTVVLYSEPESIQRNEEDFVPMTVAQLEQYFGTKLTPYVPEGMQGGSDNCGIYVKDGTPYWDAFWQIYQGDGMTLDITVCKCAQIDRTPVQNGQIYHSNGIGVVMAGGRAGFTKNGVSFYIDSGGLPEGELEKVIDSLTGDAGQTASNWDNSADYILYGVELNGYKAFLKLKGITHEPAEGENYYTAEEVVLEVADPHESVASVSLGTIETMYMHSTGRWYVDETGYSLSKLHLWEMDYNGKPSYMVSLHCYNEPSHEYIEKYDTYNDDVIYTTMFFGCDPEHIESGILRSYNGGWVYGLTDSFRFDEGTTFVDDGRGDFFIFDPDRYDITTSIELDNYPVQGVHPGYGYGVGLTLYDLTHLPKYDGEDYYAAEDAEVYIHNIDVPGSAEIYLSQCGSDDVYEEFTKRFNASYEEGSVTLLRLEDNGKAHYVIMLRNYSGSDNKYNTAFFGFDPESFTLSLYTANGSSLVETTDYTGIGIKDGAEVLLTKVGNKLYQIAFDHENHSFTYVEFKYDPEAAPPEGLFIINDPYIQELEDVILHSIANSFTLNEMLEAIDDYDTENRIDEVHVYTDNSSYYDSGMEITDGNTVIELAAYFTVVVDGSTSIRFSIYY